MNYAIAYLVTADDKLLAIHHSTKAISNFQAEKMLTILLILTTKRLIFLFPLTISMSMVKNGYASLKTYFCHANACLCSFV